MEKEPLSQSPEDSIVEEARRIVRSAEGYAVNKTVAQAKEELRDSSNPLFEIAALRSRFEEMLGSNEWYSRTSERLGKEYKISPIEFRVRCGVVEVALREAFGALEKIIETKEIESKDKEISNKAIDIVKVFRDIVSKNLGRESVAKLTPILDALLLEYRASV